MYFILKLINLYFLPNNQYIALYIFTQVFFTSVPPMILNKCYHIKGSEQHFTCVRSHIIELPIKLINYKTLKGDF
jgi:hypothetical protein